MYQALWGCGVQKTLASYKYGGRILPVSDMAGLVHPIRKVVVPPFRTRKHIMKGEGGFLCEAGIPEN